MESVLGTRERWNWKEGLLLLKHLGQLSLARWVDLQMKELFTELCSFALCP